MIKKCNRHVSRNFVIICRTDRSLNWTRKYVQDALDTVKHPASVRSPVHRDPSWTMVEFSEDADHIFLIRLEWYNEDNIIYLASRARKPFMRPRFLAAHFPESECISMLGVSGVSPKFMDKFWDEVYDDVKRRWVAYPEKWLETI
jgi:hypothetical protein